MPEQPSGGARSTAPAFLRRSRNSQELGVHLRGSGPVSYLSAKSLERPLDMPRDDFRRVLVIAGIAAVIAAALLVAYNTTVIADRHETARQVEEIINRGVTLDLPGMAELAGRNNDEILDSFRNEGLVLYDRSTQEDADAGGFDVYKLAPDVGVDEAAAAFDRGISTIPADEAAKVLSGSWRFLVNRSAGEELRLRYIDFAATTPNTAINDAMAIQKFDTSLAGEIGEDGMGNTNLAGTFDKDGTTYSYTISVCDLSQIYDIEGLPDSAQYVGIRVTA